MKNCIVLIFSVIAVLVFAKFAEAKQYCWRCQNGQCSRCQTQTATTNKSGYHWQCDGGQCRLVKDSEVTKEEPLPEVADTKPTIKDESKDGIIYAEDEEFVKIEDQILEELNRERAKYNLPPLKMVQSQRKHCRLHSRWMASRGGLFHAPGQMECIAMNPVLDGRAVARQWLNSPAHRAIVLGRYSYCSIGTFSRFHTIRMYSANITNDESGDD